MTTIPKPETAHGGAVASNDQLESKLDAYFDEIQGKIILQVSDSAIQMTVMSAINLHARLSVSLQKRAKFRN